MPFVPHDFGPPRRLETDTFVLEPLGPEHNERDYAAWTSSMDHIRSTPGFETSSWPREMTLEENRGDLERHARDFADRTGFTFTVLDPADDDVIGCLYLYPAKDDVHDVLAESWVRASRADLDVPLWEAVTAWLASDWPWTNPVYAARP
jgi:hypothetical protein